jgi:hypothetical protein
MSTRRADLVLGRLAILLGQPHAADQHFRQPMRVHQAVRCPFGTATTALHSGQRLLDRGPPRVRGLLALSAGIARRDGPGAIDQPS